MAKTQTLTFKRTVNAKPADVYRAFTSSTTMREWFSDAALADSRKGGRFYAWWNSGFYAAGEYTALTPDKKIAFAWNGRGEPGSTKVQVSIVGKKGASTVTISHGGVGTGKPWAKTIKEMTEGWEQSLENLQSTLETGEDLRLSLRPMLGITLSDFSAEIAKEMGVPVSEGIRLDGTLAGMGARAAGLQQNDVIVEMGGKNVRSFSDLAAALQGRRAGDKVPIKYYRGGKLQTTVMELSKRPLPPIPATPAELADELKRINDQVIAEVEKCFDGVTEAEASFKTGPDEWSAKDVLCHLIVGERDGHAFLDDLINNSTRYYDSFGINVRVRHEAMMAVHTTYRALLDEFKEAKAETWAYNRLLPPELVARKSTWWITCYNTLQPPLHEQGHMEQIRVAIAAARKK